MSNGCLSGKYAYDMLDLPDRLEFTERRTRILGQVGKTFLLGPDGHYMIRRYSMADLTDGLKANEGVSGGRIEPDLKADSVGEEETGDEEDRDDPLDEARGLLTQRGSKDIVVPDFLSAIGEGSSSLTPWTASPSGENQMRFKRGSNRTYPPQFDPKYFGKEGFLYGGSAMGQPILQGLAKAELAAALTDSPFATNDEIAEWGKESGDIFGRWAENRRPFEGLSGGFEKWYKKYKEAASFKRGREEASSR